MADFSVGRISRRGFGRLFSAYGRDSRMDFWIFVALVFGPLIVLQFAMQIVLAFPSMDVLAANARGDAEASRAMFESQMKGMVSAAYASIGIFLIGALLLLSATARRLHDRARAGWWALILPFGLFATGLGQARRTAEAAERLPALMEKMERQPGNPASMIDWVAQANASTHGPDWPAIVGGLLLAWLAIELARAGTDGPNRFGPAPE